MSGRWCFTIVLGLTISSQLYALSLPQVAVKSNPFHKKMQLWAKPKISCVVTSSFGPTYSGTGNSRQEATEKALDNCTQNYIREHCQEKVQCGDQI